LTHAISRTTPTAPSTSQSHSYIIVARRKADVPEQTAISLGGVAIPMM
jgi:hypothetical protein